MANNIQKSDDEWRQQLTPDQFYVTREKGTEPAFTGEYWNHHEDGKYRCVCCGAELFRSEEKFDSGCGWPSFYEPISKTSIIYSADNSFGMKRTEVECGRCKSHLGHVFDDGPPPTGLRYCINGVVLDFEKAKDAEKKYSEKKKDG